MKTGKLLTAALAVAGLAVAAPASALDLKILHINDHHSHLQPDGRMDLKLGGERTRVRAGGFPSAVALFDSLSAGQSNVLKLHAGDAITGDLFYTLFKGEADAALMNEVCFDAFTLGNHEFDDGDAGLVRFLDFLKSGSCQTPVLGANVVPEVGVSPLTKNSATDYILPYVIKDVGGVKVGIIGIDIAKKTKQSSSPDETTMFLDETETSQKMIDELAAQGVNHIVLMTHYQYKNDLAMAAELEGVDVIIGGDSHTLLGDFADVGLNSGGAYPTLVKDASGNTVCVAQAWQYSAIVGELDVSFNDDGTVASCSGTPHLPLADSFRRKNAEGKRVELEGDARAAVMASVNAKKELSVVAEDADAAALLATFSGKVDELKQEVIGTASENLCLERIPGQGKSALCDKSETAKQGSDITNLVAHAFRDMSKTSDIAIQNGGGVRVDVAAGPYTIGDAYTLLPFANTLVELDMTGAEIHAMLEDALDFALAEGGSTGAYPYAAGLRWDINAGAEKGKRFSNIEFRGPGDSAWSPLETGRTYKVVTNNYIAGGRDGYLTFKDVAKDGRILDTYLDYAQSFVDYVKKQGTIGKLPASDYSTKSFTR
ncbi:MAG: NAD nucleotidase [Rhodospirillales bacterium]|nr:NAD nucleotidase [Rhodospirillales bacterium]